MNKKQQYFAVGDLKVATIMKTLLGQYYYIFDNADGTKTYSFRYTDNVIEAYKSALLLIDNVQNL